MWKCKERLVPRLPLLKFQNLVEYVEKDDFFRSAQSSVGCRARHGLP